MASAQVVKTSVNTNNSPSQDYTTNPDDHWIHNTSFMDIFGLKFYFLYQHHELSHLSYQGLGG